jgi:hypothetical protein
MGQEAKCVARILGAEAEGRLYHEADKLLFRSPQTRLQIATTEIRKAYAEAGVLYVQARGQEAQFVLGGAAERWAYRIMNPKGVAEKLGIKAGAKVAFLGEVDKELVQKLKEANAQVSTRVRGADYDCLLVGIEESDGLSSLEGLEAAIKPNGSIWVIFPKGRQDLKGTDVINAGKSVGLVDNKIVRISDLLTAMKFVIPLARRK